MSTAVEQIRSAIMNFETERARNLIRTELQNNPTSEIYLLASQIAVDDDQCRYFLKEAIRLDPFNSKAIERLEGLERGTTTGNVPSVSVPSSSPAAKRKSSNIDININHFENADTGRRLAAYIIDIIALNVLAAIVVVLYGLVVPTPQRAGSYSQYVNAMNQWYGVVMALIVILSLVYMVYLPSRDGQTPGKAVMKIRIVKTDGSDVSMVDAFIRNVIGYTVSSLFFGIGFIWQSLIAKERRGTTRCQGLGW
ncbi:MAG: RDD family protein [Anaerolineae bacterium]